ncbi:TDP-N-acetylfucosamine:lipid II N-acetylfucosaminyltransferase [Pirellulales bacterium]|nr:TDP-N-acetylfucosamine:lipid II N-acetylfucosaminyltransferase [Pirellulales bacterium]
MKILHFCPDQKFIPFVQRTFEEAVPGASHYRVQSSGQNSPEFVQPIGNVEFVSKDYWFGSRIKEEINSSDCLLVHYMYRHFANAIRHAKKDLLIGWIGWGGDYYPFLKDSLPPLILPLTQQIRWTKTGNKNSYLHRLKRLKIIQSIRMSCSNQRDKNAISKIINRLDFLWINTTEMKAFENAFTTFKRRYHRLNYFSAEQTFALGVERFVGPDILVGNSATLTNNHVDLLEMLRPLELDGRKIIMPLSYGDSDYAQKVINYARNIFGDRVHPLVQYMTPTQYLSAISSCGTVLMNHMREQGVTTISTALYKGAKVFLRNENTLRKFYSQLDIRTHSIQDDLSPDSHWYGPLSAEETTHNRRQLTAYWGHESAITQIKKLRFMIEKKKTI